MASSERTAVPAGLPREPLDIQTNSRGFLPPVGLHARGHLYVQESSYSHLVLFAVLLVAAGALAVVATDLLALCLIESPGSIGACATPGRVFKGVRMAGRMGGERQTTQSLTVHAVDAENGLILIKGALPGPKGGLVFVRSAVKGA